MALAPGARIGVCEFIDLVGCTSTIIIVPVADRKYSARPSARHRGAKPGEPPQISPPRALFEAGLSVQFGLDQYAISRDGTRFLVRRPDQRDTTSLDRLHVIVNWPRLLASQTAPRP